MRALISIPLPPSGETHIPPRIKISPEISPAISSCTITARRTDSGSMPFLRKYKSGSTIKIEAQQFLTASSNPLSETAAMPPGKSRTIPASAETISARTAKYGNFTAFCRSRICRTTISGTGAAQTSLLKKSLCCANFFGFL